MAASPLRFSKMHGLGNDFMVVDAVRQSFNLSTAQIQQLADRHFGIGFDQLLVVGPYQGNDADFRYRIFNADGGEVEQCGNGARCFATFVREQGLTTKTEIPVMTSGGRIVLNVQADGQITVNMGIPKLEPKQIPLVSEQRQTLYTVDWDGTALSFASVSMGNPHGVIVVENVDTAPVANLGPWLESHPVFPQRANIGFMQILNRGHIRLRVFERGVGETLACGTGACAAVVVGRLQGLLDEAVQVDLRGGRLAIQWYGEGQAVLMTGPTTTVYSGVLAI
ncbi:diaminopimelate epimerase [Thiolinea disciformis]|uniref:diaminopimelate epimerase n=1 Tax=Thiolinea disciformis TaxID=125614 RepID=UPI00036F6186|nr:diaminopimelate epimerase [Thiolinea disciformis]